MANLDELDKRVAKLETQNSFQFFVQYLLSPLLIVAVGAFTNWHIERTRMEAQALDLTMRTEAQRIDLAHKMLPSLWDGNPDLAFATERLLSRVVDKEFASELHAIVVKFYQGQLKSDIQAGNFARADELVESARTVGGSAAQEVIGSVAATTSKAIQLSAASKLEIITEVGPMAVPYTVAYDGKTVIQSLVSRRESIPIAPGTHVLTWTFSHALKGWRHTISYSVDGGEPRVLDSKSEASQNPDHAVGSVQLVVS